MHGYARAKRTNERMLERERENTRVNEPRVCESNKVRNYTTSGRRERKRKKKKKEIIKN